MPMMRAFLAGLLLLLAVPVSAQPVVGRFGSGGASSEPPAALSPARSVVVRASTPAHRPVVPAPADRWIAYDKAQHFLASALLVLSAQYVLEAKGGASRHAALPLSIGVSMGAGFAKESFDVRRVGGTGFSKKDLVADAAGIAAAVAFILW